MQLTCVCVCVCKKYISSHLVHLDKAAAASCNVYEHDMHALGDESLEVNVHETKEIEIYFWKSSVGVQDGFLTEYFLEVC
jgi:hypothetical protein